MCLSIIFGFLKISMRMLFNGKCSGKRVNVSLKGQNLVEAGLRDNREIDPAIAMATVQGLGLYIAVRNEVISSMYANQTLYRCQILGGKPYLGLREVAADAVGREPNFTQLSHKLLLVEFTIPGIAHYTKSITGPEFSFQSVLTEKTYGDGVDWKVLHFNDDLRLNLIADGGEPLVKISVVDWA